MTTTYAALLRGINVGGHRKVPMADLRELLTGLGWAGVGTYLQSGNAVFTTDDVDPRARLEAALRDRVGFGVDCLLRTASELREVADACPYPAAELDASKLLVLFLDADPGPDHYARLDAERFAPDTFHHIGRAVYAYFPEGMGRSKLGGALDAVKPPVLATGRNWRTVTKLIEMTS